MEDMLSLAAEVTDMKDNDGIKDHNRRRILFLIGYFQKNTDENHPVSLDILIDELNKCEISADKKTLRSDIKFLNALNFEVVMINTRPVLYYMGSRLFEVPELKLLIDAVSSSRFITDKKSNVLIDKLKTLASIYQADGMTRHIYTKSHIKPGNESIYYMVDAINDAINMNRQISFRYTEYNADKEKIFRNDGNFYLLSPYTLLWNDDYYYVVGYSEKHNDVSSFRVDRMQDVTVIERVSIPKQEDFDITDYSGKIFDMYKGKASEIILKCDSDMMKYIVDRFGEDIETERIDENSFIARANVSVSPTFYAWVFTFTGKIRIVGPDDVTNEYENMLRSQI